MGGGERPLRLQDPVELEIAGIGNLFGLIHRACILTRGSVAAIAGTIPRPGRVDPVVTGTARRSPRPPRP
jgi:hypothetical protein